MTLREKTDVVLATDGKPVAELPQGTTLKLEKTLSGLCSFLLQKPIYGWVANIASGQTKFKEENGRITLYYRGDVPVYSEKDSSSSQLLIFDSWSAQMSYEVVEYNEEWIKIRIKYGWISGNSILPQITEVPVRPLPQPLAKKKKQ